MKDLSGQGMINQVREMVFECDWNPNETRLVFGQDADGDVGVRLHTTAGWPVFKLPKMHQLRDWLTQAIDEAELQQQQEMMERELEKSEERYSTADLDKIASALSRLGESHERALSRIIDLENRLDAAESRPAHEEVLL